MLKQPHFSFSSLKCGQHFSAFLMLIQPRLNACFNFLFVVADLWEEAKLIEPVEVVTGDAFFFFKELAVFYSSGFSLPR